MVSVKIEMKIGTFVLSLERLEGNIIFMFSVFGKEGRDEAHA